MSSQLRIPDSLAIDSRLNIASEKVTQIRRGASNTTIQRQTSSSLSNSQIVWNVQLNNDKTLIDPYMYAEVGITVSITATGLGTGTVKSYVNDLFALRQYPLASVTSFATVQLNNQSVTSNPSQWIHQLSQFQQDWYDEAAIQSITPILPDQAPEYSVLLGSKKSPLNSYVDGADLYGSPRGEFNALFTDVVNGTGTWTFTTTIREPIFNPLLGYNPADKEREGLAYVQLLNVTLSFLSNLSRMFSLDSTSAPNVNAITVNINSANLVMTWLTAPLNQALPQIVLKSFNTMVSNQSSISSMTGGAVATVQSQSYSMNQIPKKIWVYCGLSQQQTDVPTGYSLSDFTFAISNLNILFNNKSSLIANFSAADLYEACMSAEGNRMTFVQSQEFTGGVMCIDPALLFGLQDDESPGVLGNYQLQVQATVTNIANFTVQPVLFVVWAMDSILSTDSHSVSNITQGFISPQDVLAVNSKPAFPGNFNVTNVYGGSLLDTLKSAASKTFSFLREAKPISKVLGAIPHPYTQVASPIVAALGFGSGKTSKREMQAMKRAYAQRY